MVFWLVIAGLIVVTLVGGWVVDHNAARRGYKIHVRHSGIRREVTFERIERGGSTDRTGPPASP